MIIRSQNVYQNQKFIPACLQIKNGKIANILPYEAYQVGDEVLDVRNLYVMPGIVDTHAHINEPGRTEWEGFRTATMAAASGGITTVIDMPLNSIPATTSLQALEIKRKSAAGACSINYGFWGGVIPGNEHELEAMIKQGIFGFKCFLCPSGVDEFPHVTRKDLEKAMPILAHHRVPLLVHAEIESPVSLTAEHDYNSYLQSRPDSFETDAIALMIELVKKHSTPTHIVHLSTARALPMIKQAKKEGLSITVETCPHYLLFEAEKVPTLGTHFKCAPPIRDHENKEALWQGIQRNEIDFIVSDHSPCTPRLKLQETGDFIKAWGGISGLQFSLSAVWTEMKMRKFSLVDLVRLMCEQPSEFLGLRSVKGSLQQGADADLIVFDPNAEFVVEERNILHRHKITPYNGMKLTGKVKMTLIAGKQVYSEQSGVLSTPLGQELRRKGS